MSRYGGYASPVLTGKPLMMTITPAEAATILSRVKRLPGSRPLIEDNVSEFTALMSSGEWILPRRVAPIMISRSLHLLNGHHRLTALAAADKAAILPVLSEVSITDLKSNK